MFSLWRIRQKSSFKSKYPCALNEGDAVVQPRSSQLNIKNPNRRNSCSVKMDGLLPSANVLKFQIIFLFGRELRDLCFVSFYVDYFSEFLIAGAAGWVFTSVSSTSRMKCWVSIQSVPLKAMLTEKLLLIVIITIITYFDQNKNISKNGLGWNGL